MQLLGRRDAGRLGEAGVGVESGLLVRVLAVAHLLQLAQRERERLRQGVGLVTQVGRDRGVVDRDVLEGLRCQRPAQVLRHLTGAQ